MEGRLGGMRVEQSKPMLLGNQKGILVAYLSMDSFFKMKIGN